MKEITMGRRISQRRKMLGMSQESLGEKMGVSRQAISKWESDTAIPEVDRLVEMSKLFEVSVGWLLGVEEKPAAPESPEPPESEDPFVKAFRPPELALSQAEEPAALPELPEPVEKPVSPTLNKRIRWLPWLWRGVTVAALVLSVMALAAGQSSGEGTAGKELDKLTKKITKLEEQMIDQEDYNLLMQYCDDLRRELGILESDLAALDKRVDYLDGETETVPPEQAERWELTAESDMSKGTALLKFQCVTDSEITAVTMVIHRGGDVVATCKCTGGSGIFMTQTEVELADGYQYVLLLERGDGTVESMKLTGHEASDLLAAMELSLGADLRPTYFDNYSRERFWAAYDAVRLAAPKNLGEEISCCWEDLSLDYEYNGTVTKTVVLADVVEELPQAGRWVRFEIPTLTFEMPAFQSGDTHALVLYGTLVADGERMEFRRTLDTWQVKGETLERLEETTPAEAGL